MATTCHPELYYNLSLRSNKKSKVKKSSSSIPKSSSATNLRCSGETDFCIICLEDLPIEQFIDFRCSHKLCYTCFKGYLTSRLEKRKNSTNNCKTSEDPPCPYCKRVIVLKKYNPVGETPEAVAEHQKLYKKADDKMDNFKRDIKRLQCQVKYMSTYYLRYCR